MNRIKNFVKNNPDRVMVYVLSAVTGCAVGVAINARKSAAFNRNVVTGIIDAVRSGATLVFDESGQVVDIIEESTVKAIEAVEEKSKSKSQ